MKGTAMTGPFAGEPALHYVWLGLRARFAKVRSGELERGASAVEWVVISMIVVGLVVAVGFILTNALKNKATDVSNCIQGANGNGGQANC